MENNYIKEEKGYNLLEVIEEASRCLLCLDAPCSKACPAGTDPAKFIRSVRFKNIEGAADTVRTNNILAGVCARVCPTEKYCQKGCSRSGIDKPIEIGKIQRFLTDYEECSKMNILTKEKTNGYKVAVIGSGPAGLTSAANLALRGYQVTVFERFSKAGGYLRYGIPEYRLPNKVLDQEIKKISDLGVEFVFNKNIDKQELDKIQKEFSATILSTGFSKGKTLEIFKDNKKVQLAVDFLKKVKDKKGNVKVPDNAIVIGGGDVAMDVSTTLKKLGCNNVTDVVYEEFKEFRASKEELLLAQKMGVTIIDGYVPLKATKAGVVTFKHRHLDALLKIKAPLIILAIGQEAALDEFKGHNLILAGDIADGDKTVVYAVKSGKEAALKVINMLGGK